jgi:hypothetical protein
MKQDGKLHTGPMVLMVLGAVLLILAVVVAPIALQLMQPEAASLPPELGGMPIQEAMYAAEAVEMIDRMHSKSFPLSSGAVGAYGPFGEAILYISGAPTKGMAARMLVDMTDRIAENETPFTPLGEEVIDGIRVYILEGQGQQHFYYQAGELLVWLAADAWLAEQALEDCMQFYAAE